MLTVLTVLYIITQTVLGGCGYVAFTWTDGTVPFGYCRNSTWSDGDAFSSMWSCNNGQVYLSFYDDFGCTGNPYRENNYGDCDDDDKTCVCINDYSDCDLFEYTGYNGAECSGHSSSNHVFVVNQCYSDSDRWGPLNRSAMLLCGENDSNGITLLKRYYDTNYTDVCDDNEDYSTEDKLESYAEYGDCVANIVCTSNVESVDPTNQPTSSPTESPAESNLAMKLCVSGIVVLIIASMYTIVFV